MHNNAVQINGKYEYKRKLVLGLISDTSVVFSLKQKG